jgi:anti-sigma regulatory factor (Ser/Thr protein kinase)
MATFTMTSEPAQLGRLRNWLRAELGAADVPDPHLSELLLAVGELAANAIKHAYEGRGGQPIHVGLTDHGDRVEIELEDFGRPFDPERYTAPEPGILQESGWGLYLVRSLADRVSFDVARERGTRWTLVKYRAGWSTGDGRAADPARPA